MKTRLFLCLLLLASACKRSGDDGERPAITPPDLHGENGQDPENVGVAPGPMRVDPVDITLIPGHQSLQDNSPKQGPRLMPVEALLRTYLSIFGGLATSTPGSKVTLLQLQSAVRSGTGSSELFDTWTTYLATLGMPDYQDDIPRGAQMNSLMVATFERMGVALCDKSMMHDHPSNAVNPAAGSVVFDFAFPSSSYAAGAPPADFVTRLDGMHRRFLNYPLSLAAPGRAQNFFDLYRTVVTTHGRDAGGGSLSSESAAWAAICYAFIRHPEFQQY